MKLRFLQSFFCSGLVLAGAVFAASQVQVDEKRIRSAKLEPCSNSSFTKLALFASADCLHLRALDLDRLVPNKDRTAAGVDSVIRIIKQAAPESAQVFGFTTTGTGLSNFTLVDDGVDNDATPNNITFNNLLTPGQSRMFTVTESSNGFYDLTNLTCSVTGTGGSTTSANIPLATVSITLQFGDTVTCTFFNSVTSAANVSISGRIVTASGVGIPRALVSILNLSSGEARAAVTNSFGYYSIDGLEVGNLYMVGVTHKHYFFEPRTIALKDGLDGFDFIGN